MPGHTQHTPYACLCLAGCREVYTAQENQHPGLVMSKVCCSLKFGRYYSKNQLWCSLHATDCSSSCQIQ